MCRSLCECEGEGREREVREATTRESLQPRWTALCERSGASLRHPLERSSAMGFEPCIRGLRTVSTPLSESRRVTPSAESRRERDTHAPPPAHKITKSTPHSLIDRSPLKLNNNNNHKHDRTPASPRRRDRRHRERTDSEAHQVSRPRQRALPSDGEGETHAHSLLVSSPIPTLTTSRLSRPLSQTHSTQFSLGAQSRRGGDDLTTAVWSLGGALTLTLLAGSLEGIAAISFCADPKYGTPCQDIYAFAVALGFVSSLLIAAYLLFFTFGDRTKLPDKSMYYMSIFLVLWWIAGVGATTFQTNVRTDTQYFATWAALIFSCMVMHSEWSQFRDVVVHIRQFEASNRAIFYMLLASIVEFVAAIPACATGTPYTGTSSCDGNAIYALIVGPISLVICGIFLKVDPETLGTAEKFLSVFTVLWWTVALGVLTISGPFIISGNGFFATWAGFCCSFFVAQARLFPRTDNGQATTNMV